MTQDALSQDKIADLWLAHSNQLWRTVFSTPLITASTVAAWYAMMSSGQIVLAKLVLLLGIFSLCVLFLVVSRMAQFLGLLFGAIKHDLPTVPRPLAGISGKRLAQSIPILMCLMLGILLPLNNLPT